jgi:hypothetical protein
MLVLLVLLANGLRQRFSERETHHPEPETRDYPLVTTPDAEAVKE